GTGRAWASVTFSGSSARACVGTATRSAHAASGRSPTTRAPTRGPEPSAAARSTSPARSQPGRQPAAAMPARLTSPRLREIARTRTTASPRSGTGAEVLEVSDELLGRAGEPRARLHVVLDGGDAGGAPAATTRRRLDLGRRDPRHEAQGREHLHVLLVEGRDLADRLLAGLGEVEEDAEAEVLPEGEIPAGPGRGLAVSVERSLGHGRP